MHLRRKWAHDVVSSASTPEDVYLDRRRLLGHLSMAAVAVAVGGSRRVLGATSEVPALAISYRATPAKRNPAYTLDRDLTVESVAATHNNYYEFTEDKSAVWTLARGFATRPWTLQVAGLVEKPLTLDLDDLVGRMPLEERLYRHRCVEAWAMAVPWTGFPLAALLDLVKPLAGAKYVRFVSFLRPEQAPGQRKRWYKWPYYEGLRLDEARHPLALIATGIYGHELPVQHGAPLRLVVPWKYGFKSIKGIVRMDLVAEQPRTFWNDAAPREYGFLANVDPRVSHPRWSQASEHLIGTRVDVPTQLLNGYGSEVADLYRS